MCAPRSTRTPLGQPSRPVPETAREGGPHRTSAHAASRSRSPRAPEQGSGLMPGGLEVAADGAGGGAADVERYALACLVRLRVADADAGRSVRGALDVCHVEGGELRDAQERIGCGADEGGVPEALRVSIPSRKRVAAVSAMAHPTGAAAPRPRARPSRVARWIAALTSSPPWPVIGRSSTAACLRTEAAAWRTVEGEAPAAARLSSHAARWPPSKAAMPRRSRAAVYAVKRRTWPS